VTGEMGCTGQQAKHGHEAPMEGDFEISFMGPRWLERWGARSSRQQQNHFKRVYRADEIRWEAVRWDAWVGMSCSPQLDWVSRQKQKVTAVIVLVN